MRRTNDRLQVNLPIDSIKRRNCVTHHRISHAQRLLITTDKKIVDVALTVGFNSVSRFNAAFKKATDCSPREYREIHKNANHEFTFSGRI